MSQPAGKKWTSERVASVVRLCSTIVALLGLLWAVYIAWFILRAEVAEGVVQQWDVVRSTSKDSNGFSKTHGTWYAEVQYTDAQGEEHLARSPRGHNGPLWQVGQPLQLYYNPGNPDDILIIHSSSIWFPPAAILGLGLSLALLSGVALALLRRAARRNADEVAEIVAKYVTKEPLESAASTPVPVTIPGTRLRYVPFAAPPGETFTNVGHLDSTDFVPELAAAFKTLDAAVLLLVAVDDEHLILQDRGKARRIPRATIREHSVYPVLPAKACGHVQMNLELGAAPSRDYLEYFMCGPYSEEVQAWCLDKARQVASMLGVPVTLLEPGHDC